MKLLSSVSDAITSTIAYAPMQINKVVGTTLVAAMLSLGAMSSAYAVEATPAVAQHQTTRSQVVHINQATAEELADVLVGVGAAKAQAIVEYRKANGPFKTIEQLTEVKGIGDATIVKNKEHLSL